MSGRWRSSHEHERHGRSAARRAGGGGTAWTLTSTREPFAAGRRSTAGAPATRPSRVSARARAPRARARERRVLEPAGDPHPVCGGHQRAVAVVEVDRDAAPPSPSPSTACPAHADSGSRRRPCSPHRSDAARRRRRRRPRARRAPRGEGILSFFSRSCRERAGSGARSARPPSARARSRSSRPPPARRMGTARAAYAPAATKNAHVAHGSAATAVAAPSARALDGPCHFVARTLVVRHDRLERQPMYPRARRVPQHRSRR